MEVILGQGSVEVFAAGKYRWLKATSTGFSSFLRVGVVAGRETRTLTLFPEPDFESGASTGSAIPAHSRKV